MDSLDVQVADCKRELQALKANFLPTVDNIQVFTQTATKSIPSSGEVTFTLTFPNRETPAFWIPFLQTANSWILSYDGQVLTAGSVNSSLQVFFVAFDSFTVA